MRARLVLRAVGALTLVMGAAACGGDVGSPSSSAPDGKPPATPTGTLRVALSTQPPSLDPTTATSGAEWQIVTALYDGLITRTPQAFDRLSPGLATSWKSNADATEWTFALRKGVEFSDGTAFDAAAAKTSIEYAQRVGSVFSFAVGPIAKITTPDPSTLVISYKAPFPDLGSYLPLIMMISPKLLDGPQKTVEKRVASQAAGTGPYVLDRFSSATGVTAHANRGYWAKGPYIEKLELRPIPEESARNAALQAGDVDMVTGVSGRTAKSLSRDPRLRVASVSSWTTEALSLPAAKKPLDDARVRRALAYAIDPGAIAENVLLGQATITGSLMPPGTYGFRKPAAQYSHDPAKAKALLAEAGVRQPVSLKLAVTGEGSSGLPVAQALAEQAKAGGFDIQVVTVSNAVALEDEPKPQRKYDLGLDPRGWVNGGPLHLAAGLITGNANYKGPALLDLIAKINTTPNGPEREGIIGDALEEAARELPAIPLWALKVSDVSVRELQGHVPPKDGYLPNWSQQYLAR